jgi:hypothetical protein
MKFIEERIKELMRKKWDLEVRLRSCGNVRTYPKIKQQITEVEKAIHHNERIMRGEIK